ncbi:MAG: hypothetical protein AB1600_04860 [Bacteroidota bacterium]
MEQLLMLAQIIVLFALSGLAIYFIIVLTKVREVLSTFDTNMKEITSRTIPTLQNLEVITSKLRSVVENIDEQMDLLRSSAETIRGVADNIASFERRVQEAIESPVMEVMNTIGGVIRGFTTFLSRIVGGSSS